MMWLELFLQCFVQAIAWCLAAVIVGGPASYFVLVLFHCWRRASRAAVK